MNIRTLCMMTITCLALSLPVMADHHDSEERGGKHRSMKANTPDSVKILHQMLRGVKQLDLSDEQHAAIEGIVDSSREDLRANMMATRDSHSIIRALLTADGLDEEALAAAAKQQGDLTAERILITGNVASQVLAELDETQRATLHEMAQEMREDRRSHRERRSNRS